jgi:hypothetical protein
MASTITTVHTIGSDAALGGLLLALAVTAEADSATPALLAVLENAEGMFARFTDEDAATELVEAITDAQLDSTQLQAAAALAFAGDSEGALGMVDDLAGNIA